MTPLDLLPLHWKVAIQVTAFFLLLDLIRRITTLDIIKFFGKLASRIFRIGDAE